MKKFQNLIGMLGSPESEIGMLTTPLFQNLIGMLGRGKSAPGSMNFPSFKTL